MRVYVGGVVMPTTADPIVGRRAGMSGRSREKRVM